MRTALDYLVFELAKLDSNGVPQDKTQFPIENCRKDFRSRIKRGYLDGINARHITQLELLQPYKGCAWTRSLRTISNKDKHREFVTLGGSGSLKILNFPSDPGSPDTKFPIFRAPSPATGEIMDMKLDFTPEVSFDDGTPAMQTLEKIKLGVADTLKEFKSEF